MDSASSERKASHDAAERKSTGNSPWRGADFALPLIALIPSIDVAAIAGGQAETLKIPGAAIVQASPLFLVAGVVLIPLVLFSTPVARFRHLVVLCWVGLCVFSAPLLLAVGSRKLSVSRPLTEEERSAFRKAFPIPMVSVSASGEGDLLLIRRSDDSAELSSYLSKLGILRGVQPP